MDAMERKYNALNKKFHETLKKTEKLFSAARYEEMIRVGYDISLQMSEDLEKHIPKLVEELVSDCVENPEFMEEILYGRTTHPAFRSRFPKLHRKLVDLITVCGTVYQQPNNPFAYEILTSNRCLGVEYVQLIRNQVILRNWTKFRKAYVFDKELTNALSDMSDSVDLPVEMPESLPFPTVYFEFPKGSKYAECYSGVFISVRHTSDIKRITENNVKILNAMVQQADMNLYNIDDDLRHWLKQQQKYNIEDDQMVKEHDYISLHLLFIGHHMDESGFNETFTYIMPLSANEKGICHVLKSDVKEKVYRDDFIHKDELVEIIMFILNALMYLGANNADIETRKIKGLMKLAPLQKNKKRKLSFIDNDIELNECGFIYGSTVRKYKEQQEKADRESAEHCGKHFVPPHPVRGHYERYYVGKGREKVVWKLKLPYMNHGSVNMDAPVNVSIVEE